MLHRTDGNYGETVQAVALSLMNLYVMSDKMMQRVRKGVRETSKVASWENFIEYYDHAYAQALDLAALRKQ